ncbi:hypothetical protein PENTCL1PPCAC_3073, partial [Pristionchus entomophagus]
LFIFSAPNYLNYKNDCCIVKVSASFQVYFVVFRSINKSGKTPAVTPKKARHRIASNSRRDAEESQEDRMG